ncbi:hypothetical protein [Escherichia coli]|uniref:hypothetical protein n=1 Tax=Escherichia coli TaxID=562 RepID=UPI003BF886BB
MDSIIKYIIAAVILFCSNSVHAECSDTPAESKAQDIVEIKCISQENNLISQIYTTIDGKIDISFTAIPIPSCDKEMRVSRVPSKVINGKSIRFIRLCDEYTEAPGTYGYDVPETKAGFNYIKKQILKNKPLVVTSPNPDNPFKATFDTHKYREMILDAFNANDGIHGGI